jgi:hypothetical protein
VFAGVGTNLAGLGPPEAVVRDMLDRWIARGRVARLDAGTGCTRCGRQGRCSASADGGVELHRWVEVGADDPPAGTSSP